MISAIEFDGAEFGDRNLRVNVAPPRDKKEGGGRGRGRGRGGHDGHFNLFFSETKFVEYLECCISVMFMYSVMLKIVKKVYGNFRW